MQNEKSIIFTSCALVVCLLATAELAGCGGQDSPALIQTSDYPSCGSTASLASVQGYPIYRVSTGAFDKCAVIAHYNAGYAVVATEDIDVWGPTDNVPSFKIDSGVSATEPPDTGLVINTVAQGTAVPEATKDIQAGGFVIAKSNEDGSPFECQLPSDSANQADVDECLESLRSGQAQLEAQKTASTRSVPLRAAADNSPAPLVGNTNPDPSAWTLLGQSSQEVSLESYSDNWWQADQKTGSTKVQFTLYRLNSNTQNDYYLVKASWETTPEPRVNKYHPTRADACKKGEYCGYYNNQHSLEFSLSVLRDGIPIVAQVESYMPKTVERNRTVTERMGAELGFGDKGIGAKVSGEVSTSYSYAAQNIIASSSKNSLQFVSSHATAYSDIWNADPTTVGTAGTIAWGLFSVPAGNPAAKESVQIKVSKLEGNFGLRSDNGLISQTYLYDYKLTSPYTISYSTPVFRVNVVNGDDSLGPVPSGRNNAIRLKAGESTELAITAGNYETPIRLAWQVTNLPDWIVASVDKGGLIAETARLSSQCDPTPRRVRSVTS
ncbi:hypothetical protein B7760_05991 (plasmid) [Burkholderia glumae]|nr:hypothetical protein B7760_05991 [Burkholderia glumae]